MDATNPFRILSTPLEGAANYWRDDPVLQGLLERLLTPAARRWLGPQLERMGAVVPERVDPLSRLADRYGPTLRPYDAWGNRVDEVVFHPSYREMEQVAYGGGLVATKYDPEVRRLAPAEGHTLGFALTFLFAQAESGLTCPVCMTDGVARVVERLGSEAQRVRLLPRLATRDMERLMRGAMFLTEKQGGSDVGAVATRAVRDGERWRLWGEKWFCSNVDAEAILALARVEGGAEGTRGLGLFLVETSRLGPRGTGGAREGMRIERIKDKLGVRSMATGEVTFGGALAEPVGPLESGFKSMAEMINLSRLYNAFASVAIVRRAAYEATRYLRARHAFGRRGIDLPLVRETLADLHAEEIAAKHLVFQTAEHLDRADAGGPLDARRVRILTPLAKYTTARLAVWAASEAIELHGGNGYIEDFVTPRLLRDAQVLPVWEGTTNILVLDVLRACQKGGAHELLLADVLSRCEAAPRELAEEAERIRGLAGGLGRQLAELSKLSADREAPRLKRWSDRLALVYSVSLLLEAAGRAGREAPILSAAAQRLVQRHLDPDRDLQPAAMAALVERTVVATEPSRGWDAS